MDNIKEKLQDYITYEAESLGYQIVDVKIRSNRPVSIEVVVDKAGGVSIGECSKLNKKVGLWIENNNLFSDGYTIDVCSPGLDRIIKSDSEFNWAKGKCLEVFIREPIKGKTSFSGILSGVANDQIELSQEDSEEVIILKLNITKARLKCVL